MSCSCTVLILIGYRALVISVFLDNVGGETRQCKITLAFDEMLPFRSRSSGWNLADYRSGDGCLDCSSRALGRRPKDPKRKKKGRGACWIDSELYEFELSSSQGIDFGNGRTVARDLVAQLSFWECCRPGGAVVLDNLGVLLLHPVVRGGCTEGKHIFVVANPTGSVVALSFYPQYFIRILWVVSMTSTVDPQSS
jgi:hypothetical protein